MFRCRSGDRPMVSFVSVIRLRLCLFRTAYSMRCTCSRDEVVCDRTPVFTRSKSLSQQPEDTETYALSRDCDNAPTTIITKDHPKSSKQQGIARTACDELSVRAARTSHNTEYVPLLAAKLALIERNLIGLRYKRPQNSGRVPAALGLPTSVRKQHNGTRRLPKGVPA